MKHLIFDTETTGMLQFNQPDSCPKQPRMVQLACVLCDEKLEIVSSFYCLIKPDGWSIEPEAFQAHGIPQDKCEAFGIPSILALGIFCEYLKIADRVIAHNISFDSRVLNIECCRTNYSMHHNWTNGKNFCTMKLATDVCKMPGKIPGRYKWPKLAEAYRYFCGDELKKAHDAMADVMGCREVYRKLMEGDYIK